MHTEIKGHDSVKSVDGVKVLNLCLSSDNAKYICTKFCKSISKGFRVRDPDSRVDGRVVADVDGRTYVRTYVRKTGSLHRAMPEAGATKCFKSVL